MDRAQPPARTRLSMHRLHHSGVRVLRVLVIGESAALHAPLTGGTMAERAADRIWLGTRRGVDLDVLTDLAPVLRAVHGVFRTWRLWRYDVVVVLIGDGGDASRRPRALARVGELLGEVLEDAASATDVVVLAAGDGGSGRRRHAPSAADRLREQVDALDSGRIRFRAVTGGDDPLERARAWAAAVGIEVAASVGRLSGAEPTATARARRDVSDDEVLRQRALDELRLIERGHDPRLDDLVELARSAFGTESAAVNFIDRDRQWRGAVVGADGGPAPRSHSFCNVSIQRAEPTVVSDASIDPLFRHSPLVSGPHPIRFYAGYPIESVEGYRIGSFCIFDSAPRDADSVDLSVLRDLALMAQKEITGVDAAPEKRSPAAG